MITRNNTSTVVIDIPDSSLVSPSTYLQPYPFKPELVEILDRQLDQLLKGERKPGPLRQQFPIGKHRLVSESEKQKESAYKLKEVVITIVDKELIFWLVIVKSELK